jgi:hypothetical protein
VKFYKTTGNLVSDYWKSTSKLLNFSIFRRKNGKPASVKEKFEVNETELCSIDEQNIMLTLQAQSLQIYRELPRRRNQILRSEHHDAEKFDPNELVIDIPELKATHHCYNKRTVDRRTKFRELSYSESAESKFIVGNDYSKLPKLAQAVFRSILSGEDHGIFFAL